MIARRSFLTSLSAGLFALPLPSLITGAGRPEAAGATTVTVRVEDEPDLAASDEQLECDAQGGVDAVITLADDGRRVALHGIWHPLTGEAWIVLLEGVLVGRAGDSVAIRRSAILSLGGDGNSYTGLARTEILSSDGAPTRISEGVIAGIRSTAITGQSRPIA